MRYSFVSIAALLFLIPAALGHSWIEQLRVIDETGSFTGEWNQDINEVEGAGFCRNNIKHEVMKSNDDIIYRIQSLDPDKPLCRPEQSKAGAVSAGSPALKASPGDMVALRYAENGHTTKLEEGRPLNAGTVYIYGTTKPKDDEKLMDIFKVWTADGKGGDGRGRLLATRNYDDGKCFESGGTDRKINKDRADKFPNMDVNSEMGRKLGLGLWCQTDFTIPADLKAEGSLAVYWVWDWTMINNPTVEMYSTCMDIELVPGPGTSKNLKFSQTDLNRAAIESQLTNQFDVEIPEMGAMKGKTQLPGQLPDQANVREGGPEAESSSSAAATASAAPAPSQTSAPTSEQPKNEQKPTSTAQVSPQTLTPDLTQSQAEPKATDPTTLPPGVETFVPGMEVPPVTVTVTKDGPTSFATVYIAVGSSFVPGQESNAPATSGAGYQVSLSPVEASSASQTSAPAAPSTGGPAVTGFLDQSGEVATPAPAPYQISTTQASTSIFSTDLPSSTSLVVSSSTVSPTVPATTEAPAKSAVPQPTSEALQVITEEATVTEFQTITTSYVKAFVTTSVESPLPTLSETQGYSNGTMTARSLPRMRRVRRAL